MFIDWPAMETAAPRDAWRAIIAILCLLARTGRPGTVQYLSGEWTNSTVTLAIRALALAGWVDINDREDRLFLSEAMN
jgi:hypothetical protein